MKRLAMALLVTALLAGTALSQEAPRPPKKVMIEDAPNDHGTALDVKWTPSEDDDQADPKVALPPGFGGYKISRRKASEDDDAWKPVGEAKPGSPMLKDEKGIETEVGYLYRVSAYSLSYTLAGGLADSYTPFPLYVVGWKPIQPPEGEAGPTGYRVYRAFGMQDDKPIDTSEWGEEEWGGVKWTALGDLADDAKEYEDRDVNGGQAYLYRVVALYGSEEKDEVFKTEKPVKPAGAVNVTWVKVAEDPDGENFTGYEVIRSLPWKQTAEVGADTTAFVDDTAMPGSRYSYRITALVGGAEVEVVRHEDGLGAGIIVEWPPSKDEASDGFMGYEVYRKVLPPPDEEVDEDAPAPKWILIGKLPAGWRRLRDEGLKPDELCLHRVVARTGKDQKLDDMEELFRSPEAEACGKTIKLRWDAMDGASGYRIYRTRPWKTAGMVPLETKDDVKSAKTELLDKGLDLGATYIYRVKGITEHPSDATVVSAPGVPYYNWFKLGRFTTFMAVMIFSGFLLGWIWAAGRRLSGVWVIGFFLYTAAFAFFIKLDPQSQWYQVALPFLGPIIATLIPILRGGSQIYIRPIPAIQAVEEAIGRATEMGKPVLFVPGISTIDDVATLAALNILSPVAEKAAEYDSKLIVPNYDPIVFTVTQEVVKESYLKAGRPDAYSDENVFYLSARQFAYAAAVNGIMMREKPATNFFLGMFYAESLLLAETGNMTGAIQIAGTDAVTQLPFFIVACDYTLIGEELYAAGAYMGDNPKLTGSLKGQDWNKAVLILILLACASLFVIYGAIESPKKWGGGVRDIPAKLFESKDK